MISGSPDPTFRDPAGSLVLESDRAVRQIRPEYWETALEFLDSTFYRTAVERGDMTASIVEKSRDALQLIHPRVRTPSYPWEWTPSQWLAAAELTLNLCEEALDDGWILKDATPLNILFIGSRPVFVDVLSFERRDPTSSLWLPYGQYIRTFVLPLLMKKMLHWPLELSFFKRDGYEPSQLYAAMRWTQRLSPSAFWPITLPALLERRKSNDASATIASTQQRDPGLALHTLKQTLASLRKRTRAAVPQNAASDWASYTDTLQHYTHAESEAKKAWVQKVLSDLHPTHVLDIGANTGEFSALAATSGAQVVALERDEEAAERIAHLSQSKNLSIQTIHADLARPTPAAGWDNRETLALLPRLEGQFDLVLMLAVIHHLLLLEQIPLPAILGLCHRLTQRYLIIEWVPATDPMFVSLMRGRVELYGALDESNLLAATEGRFNTLQRLVLDNGRILFLFERLPDVSH